MHQDKRKENSSILTYNLYRSLFILDWETTTTKNQRMVKLNAKVKGWIKGEEKHLKRKITENFLYLHRRWLCVGRIYIYKTLQKKDNTW